MAKKSFKSNPALAFIDTADAEEGQATTPTGGKEIPAGYRKETKSKRVQILLKPSLYSDAKALAEELGISLNDFIHRAVQEATYNEYVREQIEKDTRG